MPKKHIRKLAGSVVACIEDNSNRRSKEILISTHDGIPWMLPSWFSPTDTSLALFLVRANDVPDGTLDGHQNRLDSQPISVMHDHLDFVDIKV